MGVFSGGKGAHNTIDTKPILWLAKIWTKSRDVSSSPVQQKQKSATRLFKGHVGIHLADRPRSLSTSETPPALKAGENQHNSILVGQSFSACDVTDANQEENWNVNSLT